MKSQIRFIAVALSALIYLFSFVSSQDPVKSCYGEEAHGGILFFNPKDSSEKQFGWYHMAEFECPHQWDALVYLLPEKKVQELLKSAAISSSNRTYSLAPSFSMVDLSNNRVDSFTADVLSGFFGDAVIKGATFQILNVPKVREFNLQGRPSQLTYEAFFTESSDQVVLKHLVVSPPEFDHLLLASFQFVNSYDNKYRNRLNRKFPFTVVFNKDNSIKNKLGLYSQQRGKLTLPDSSGSLVQVLVQFKILDDVYPGADKLNGDGTNDLKTLCLVKERPTWDLCL